jgi:hypothetical protein
VALFYRFVDLRLDEAFFFGFLFGHGLSCRRGHPGHQEDGNDDGEPMEKLGSVLIDLRRRRATFFPRMGRTIL